MLRANLCEGIAVVESTKKKEKNMNPKHPINKQFRVVSILTSFPLILL